jgi:guanine deaminase
VRLPDRPPFAIRARIISPLASGETLDLRDGLLVVDADGRIEQVIAASAATPDVTREAIDARRLVLLPGLVDLHAHLPQLPSAGLGFGMGLLPWLERHVFPLELGWADGAVAGRVARAAFEAMAAAGTTTVLAYGAVYAEGLAAAFEAAEAHGIRAILGKVMMDRGSYDTSLTPARILDRSVRESIDLARTWHGAAGGRLGYAFTPRFAVSCTAELLRASADAAQELGAWWQTHVGEDAGEIAAVASLFPEARDYVDVYDRAGALGPRSILAHAVHLTDRELARLVETDTRIAHCPASNLFLGSGVMPLARYRAAGLGIGLGSDVAGGPEVSLFTVMRAGAWSQVARRSLARDARPLLGPLDWLRLGTLEGAHALGLEATIGSLEPGKAADVIAVDPAACAPLPAAADPGGNAAVPDEDDGDAERASAEDVVSRLIFRPHPEMVRGAWVDGRRLGFERRRDGQQLGAPERSA